MTITIAQAVGVGMLAIFSIALVLIIQNAMGSWKETTVIIFISLLATLWVVVGAALMEGIVAEKIEVDKKEYEELVNDQKFLNALMAAGVDNWEGYEIAQESIED